MHISPLGSAEKQGQDPPKNRELGCGPHLHLHDPTAAKEAVPRRLDTQTPLCRYICFQVSYCSVAAIYVRYSSGGLFVVFVPICGSELVPCPYWCQLTGVALTLLASHRKRKLGSYSARDDVGGEQTKICFSRQAAAEHCEAALYPAHHPHTPTCVLDGRVDVQSDLARYNRADRASVVRCII